MFGMHPNSVGRRKGRELNLEEKETIGHYFDMYKRWKKGEKLYTNDVERLHHILKKYPDTFPHIETMEPTEAEPDGWFSKGSPAFAGILPKEEIDGFFQAIDDANDSSTASPDAYPNLQRSYDKYGPPIYGKDNPRMSKLLRDHIEEKKNQVR